MTIEIAVIAFVTFIVTLIFSLSIMLNVLLTLATVAGIWYFRNSLSERAELLTKLQEYEATKHIIKNIEQIGEHVLQLKYVLEEVARSNLMYNEPVYQSLMEVTHSLLQDIYIFDDEDKKNEETQK